MCSKLMGFKKGTLLILSPQNAERGTKTPQHAYLLSHKANITQRLCHPPSIALSATVLSLYHPDKCCALFMFAEQLTAISLIFRSLTSPCKVQLASAASYRGACRVSVLVSPPPPPPVPNNFCYGTNISRYCMQQSTTV